MSKGYANYHSQPDLDKIDYNRFETCPTWRQKSRVFDDPCSVNIRENQSVDTGNYHVTNFFRKCGEPVMTDCTLNQTMTYPRVWGNVDQCNTNLDSQFRYAPLTNLNNIHQLSTRPYVSSGYRGAGSNNGHLSDVESSLIQGQYKPSLKSCESAKEHYIDRFHYLPEYGNPQRVQHVVEPWTRGGILSTELVRKLNYQSYCSKFNPK